MKRQNYAALLGMLFLMPSLMTSQGGFPGNFSTGGNFLGFTTILNNPQPLNVRNDFGTNNATIDFYTNNLIKAQVTTNSLLVNSSITNSYNFSTPVQIGDGIRISASPTSYSLATLDLFTSILNQTFIRMDGMSLMQTTNNRFEHISNLNGFWYNATGNGANQALGGVPQFIWNITGTERGRLGSNGKWRYGLNPGNANANNRVEIQSNVTDPYFPVNAVNGSSGLRLTNLTSLKTPVANGTNGVNYSRVLSVDQNGDVVLVPSNGLANNGVSINNGTLQLGAPCPANFAQTTAAQLTGNRQLPLNGSNFTFAGATGSVGIGTPCVPGNKLEVNNNTGPNAKSGLRLKDLANNPPSLPNTLNKVLSVDLAGDVILTPAPTGIGNLCTALQNPLTGEFEIPLGTFKYRFTGQSQITTNPALQQDMVSIGYPCG